MEEDYLKALFAISCKSCFRGKQKVSWIFISSSKLTKEILQNIGKNQEQKSKEN